MLHAYGFLDIVYKDVEVLMYQHHSAEINATCTVINQYTYNIMNLNIT